MPIDKPTSSTEVDNDRDDARDTLRLLKCFVELSSADREKVIEFASQLRKMKAH